MSKNGSPPDFVAWMEKQEPLLSELPPYWAARIKSAINRSLPKNGAQTVVDWHIYNLAHAYASQHRKEYVVPNLFLLPSLSIVYGAPGTYKSFLLADLAVCVASGQPWLPPKHSHQEIGAQTIERRPVLWCDFDNGKPRTHERFGALGRARDLPVDTPLYYVSMPEPGLNARSDESVDNLKFQIMKVGAKLIIIDNLGLVSGGADENSIEMAQVLNNFRHVAEKTKSAVVLIHHQRKGSGKSTRLGESLRGHSSIEASIDLALLVKLDEKRPRHVEVGSTKTRDEAVAPFAAEFVNRKDPHTNRLEKAQFYGVAASEVAEVNTVRQAILQVVKSNPGINKGTLTKAAYEEVDREMGVNRIGKLIDRMVKDGDLVETGGGGTTKSYSLPAKYR
jgi:hypothetical protein